MAELGRNWERESLSRGRFRLTQHIKPICYNDAGILKRINSAWADSGITGRPHIVTASQMMCSVGDDGMRRIHPTREVARYMEVGAPYVKVGGVWKKVSFQNVIRTGPLLAWTRAEANLAIIHAGHYIKLGMELKNGYVPEQGLVAFPVGLTGLTRSGGNILADGVTVAQLRAPMVYDAANPLTAHRPISWQFTTLSGQPYLVMTLPSLTGLTRPVVDPTLTLQPDATDGIDTYLPRGFPGTHNCGANVLLEVGRYNSDGAGRGLIQFNVSSIPSSASISAATLTLYRTYSFEVPSYDQSIYRGLTQWFEGVQTDAEPGIGEDGSTWAYRNANGSVAWAGGGGGGGGSDYAATPTDTVTVSATGYWDWNVMADVALWVAGTATNYGHWLMDDDLTNYVNQQFASSDHATAVYRPKLVIEYTVASGCPKQMMHYARMRRAS